MKNNIEEVLVSPGYVELVFLQQRHEQFLPVQPNRRHVILKKQTLVKRFLSCVRLQQQPSNRVQSNGDIVWLQSEVQYLKIKEP